MSNVKSSKKVPRKKKAANGYQLPNPIPNGEILTDVLKKKWQIGPSIGVGGFGEIYSASDVISSPKKNAVNPFAIKIEPHGNGPLFVEMHVYMKLGKEEQINEWRKQKKLAHVGMPRFIGSGSHESKGVKYRFVVMDRFSKDIWSLFLENNRIFPTHTVIKIAYQVLNILEYFHSKSYVHADIKGANLMLGLKKGTENQIYLVDLGLACTLPKEYKPNPLKAHDGTPEYTSRDAHTGVPSMRGDLEILGYNMVQWLCSKLPWEDNLSDVVKLHQQKIKFMEDIPGSLKACFSKRRTAVPDFLVKYFKHIEKLAINQVPDYDYCYTVFKDGLKKCNASLDGKLEFKSTKRSPPVTDSVNDSEDFVECTPSPPKKARGVALKTKTKSKKSPPGKSASRKPLATKPSWRDCPTAIASGVDRPGEYSRSK